MEVCQKLCDNDIPPSIQLEVSHQQQKSNWDCGVSCVLMVLPEKKRQDFQNNFNKICKEQEFNKSTWTIDLCYLLLRYGVKYVFCTVTLGINPEYHEQTFYARVLHKDEERVMRRFNEAEANGISVRQVSLKQDDLIQHLARHGPIILLTNANLLSCDICKCKKLITEIRSWLPWSISYNGHYIVLCGYNLSRQKFYYHNPTYRSRVCCMSFSAMDEARQSYGTDEDTILIYQ
ncbi:protein GUCD1 [Anabrus simplex]|uniref:protein GUCD1 n=1 Tax=Anabrus simplex TaxID=316456 RepID=UPI0035A2DCBC